MTTITASGEGLGATIEGLDLSCPLSLEEIARIREAFGQYGVLCFPGQTLDGAALKMFGSHFGRLSTSALGMYEEPGIPEVMWLSNIIENGQPIGLQDAGQSWHTDMSYDVEVALANILYAVIVPRRRDQVLGDTEFQDMHAAYEALPEDIKRDYATTTATHDFHKFWDLMRFDKGSARPPLTEAQRAKYPPHSHPLFVRHPITARKVIYANPGYTTHINGLPEAEGAELLALLFEHQLKAEFRYAHHWDEGDVLMWDDIGTIHRAAADYLPSESRLVKRVRVMAGTTLE